MSIEVRPKVSIILLNLNGYNDTRDCLETIKQAQYRNYNVILVDNGSTDNSSSRLEKEFPHICLLKSERNLGFTGGNNLGIKAALQDGAEYVLLLNNDTVVDSDLLTHLVQVGETDSRIGILGAKIFYASDPRRIWYAGGYVKYGMGVCRHNGLDQIDEGGNFSRVEETQFVTGCAMMIKSQVLRDIGLLDPRLFIYWEDADFCMRAQKAGYRCVFVPEAQLWHKISRTCGPQSPFTLYLHTRNHLIWVAEHVPFPFKPGALIFTFVRKILKVILLAPKSRDSATAVLGGIWAFLVGAYGAPRTKRPARVSTAVAAGSGSYSR